MKHWKLWFSAWLLSMPALAMGGDDDSGGDTDAPDIPRCASSVFVNMDTCTLRTDVGNRGWLVDHAGLVDKCQYRCTHWNPPFPPTFWDGFASGSGVMTCPAGTAYQSGSSGHDCRSVRRD